MLVNLIKLHQVSKSNSQTNSSISTRNHLTVPNAKISFGMSKDKFVLSGIETIMSHLIKQIDSKDTNDAVKLIQNIGAYPSAIAKKQIALFTESGETITNIALAKEQPQIAESFIDFISTLDKKTQNKFALLVNKDGHTQLNVALINKQPKIAEKFFMGGRN